MRHFLLLSAATALSAQNAQVSGIIRDVSGGGIPGASITLTMDDTGTRRMTRSGAEGWYSIPATQPGVYKIRVSHEGFQTAVQFGIVLEVAERARIDFTLHIGPMEDSISVTSERSAVDGESSLGTLIGRDLIDRLPLSGRGLAALLELVPGVVITPAGSNEAGQFSASGSRAGSNYITVDGVSANAGVQLLGLPGGPSVKQSLGGTIPIYSALGTLQSLAAPDTIEEFRLQSSGGHADTGRTSGAHVALVTRSGTNQLHGSLYSYVRNEALDANNWFANQSGEPRGRVRLRDTGFTLGGPVARDRTFFFAAYERLDLSHSQVETQYLPTLNARLFAPDAVLWLTRALPLPNGPPINASQGIYTVNAPRASQMEISSLRLDQALGASAQFFARFSSAPSSDTKQYPGALVQTRLTLASRSITAGLDHTIGGDIHNSVRVSRTSVREESTVSLQDGIDLRGASPALHLPSDTSYAMSVISLGVALGADRAAGSQAQWNILDTLGHTAGTHTMQAGGDFRSLAPELTSSPYLVNSIYQDLDALAAGKILFTSVYRREPVALRLRNISAFAHDSWRVASRVLINYGLRWEQNPAPSSDSLAPRFAAVTLGSTPLVNLAAQGSELWSSGAGHFAPRLGAAVRLLPNGRLVMRGSVGWFYDLGFGPALEAAVSESMATLVHPSASGDARDYHLDFQSGGSPDLATVSKLVSNFASPYSIQWNASVESQIARPLLASISYVGTSGSRLLRNELVLFPGLGLNNVFTNGGSSSYQALQLQARSRFARRLDGLVSFTWGHSLDNDSRDGDLYSHAQWPGSVDRGNSSFDVRRSFSAALTSDLPGPRRFVLYGWGLAGILRARTGFPVTVNGVSVLLPRGEQSRPDRIATEPLWLADSNAPAGRRLNPSAFMMPAGVRPGTLGRNSIAGFGMMQLDLSLERQFAIGARAQARLRIEAFNVSNHANFGNPDSFLGSPSFGRTVSMLDRFLGSGGPANGLVPVLQIGGPRSLQIALRLRF